MDTPGDNRYESRASGAVRAEVPDSSGALAVCERAALERVLGPPRRGRRSLLAALAALAPLVSLVGAGLVADRATRGPVAPDAPTSTVVSTAPAGERPADVRRGGPVARTGVRRSRAPRAGGGVRAGARSRPPAAPARGSGAVEFGP
jgi:hypothetical protein